jgi:hypothetical protein
MVGAFIANGDMAGAAAAYEFIQAQCENRPVSPYVYQVRPAPRADYDPSSITCRTRPDYSTFPAGEMVTCR